ncbi:uncharacterized protein LOC107265900 isoform X2 [Cephus cinctus]|uniref:Uncharacterized protein LOC107265900 isoform X2 n=1 Tax=Cephus cinctus TaxID=211228 RepID=A0AAJ7FGY2_CEPCN|nr:uncharacterized protein LOC107265900 isoform X2 [Cephus cinctus]
MGCAPSGTPYKSGGLRLMATKITFTKDQLDNLNAYFLKNIEEEHCRVLGEITEIEGIVERLVQRLIVAVGNLDSRFSSMFLVSLNERRRIKQLRFEYLVRLDALSTPTVLQDNESAVNIEEDTSMPGFARLKILGSGAESWSEFLGPAGRIRRDLLKNRLTNLLAAAIKPETIKEIDDRTCFTPGQVVDPEILDNILKQPDHCRIFFGPATSEGTFPEPRDHRIAIVEDASGILLKVGLGGIFSKKCNEIEVKLLIGAATATWSSLADYPRRVPLHHCDALLHFTAAQSGMYVVAVGPHPGARCEDRATLWKIRIPAVETIADRYYSEDSVPSLTESVLMEILNQLRGRRSLDLPIKTKDVLRIVSRHILKTIHWWSLERAGPDPLRSWAPNTLSRHVLLVLDELVTALKCQNLRCYFYPRCNVMLQCTKGDTLHDEDSYISDSRVLESYLSILHQHSLNMSPSVPKPIDTLENELISRWKRTISSLPRGTMGTHCGYTVRQLEYLGLVVKEVLGWKEHSAEGFENGSFSSFPISPHSPEPVENLLYLVTLVLRQAREQIYVITDCRNRKQERRKLKSYGRRKSNTATYFDRSVDVLVDLIRRDRETAYLDLESNSIMARTLLKWLYFAMENDKKTLGPILRPYLGNLFNSSHENAWHVESWKKRREILATEMRSLALFCKLVTAQEVSPADGIVEALSKGWLWAENITRMIERSDQGLKLVFITSTRVIKYNLTFSNNKGLSTFSTWSKARNISNAHKRTTIATANMLTTCLLQEPSPVTQVRMDIQMIF